VHDEGGARTVASRVKKVLAVHSGNFPGLYDRVLSKCSDAHIYLDQGTYSPFQRWQSAFVSSGI